MPTYPPLPDPPTADPETDTAQIYGCRILYFLLATGVYATCTDEQLRLAEHAAGFAVTACGILSVAVDRLSAVRHEIAATLRRRVQLMAETAQNAQPASGTPVRATIDGRPDDRTDPSGRVPRRPYPIAPSSGDTIDPPRRPVISF